MTSNLEQAHASPIDPDLLDMLVCPLTRSKLRLEQGEGEDGEGELVAQKPEGAGLRYPIRDGVPILLIHEARLPDRVADLEEFKRKYAADIAE